MSHPDTWSDEMRKRIPASPCPKCGVVMELKALPDLSAALGVGVGNTLVVWQCPACKNVEVQ